MMKRDPKRLYCDRCGMSFKTKKDVNREVIYVCKPCKKELREIHKLKLKYINA